MNFLSLFSFFNQCTALSSRIVDDHQMYSGVLVNNWYRDPAHSSPKEELAGG